MYKLFNESLIFCYSQKHFVKKNASGLVKKFIQSKKWMKTEITHM